MSLGYIGCCKKYIEDENQVYYLYSGSNWNNPDNKKEAEKAYDGIFYIMKNPVKQMITLPIIQISYIDIAFQAIKNGSALIEKECKNAFRRYSKIDIDYIGFTLIKCVFKQYLRDGIYPESDAFIQ